MRCLCVLVAVLGLSAVIGCSNDKGEWDEFWKDVRGDNMQMRSFSGMSAEMDRPAPRKPAAD